MALIKSISGIRGTLKGKPGNALTPIDVVKFTAAFGSWLKSEQKNKKVVIGRDARASGEIISALVSSTLRSLGINVVDIGLSTTPTVEIATSLEKAGGGIVITASHNPIQWNALKLLNHKGEFISSEEGNTVLQLAHKEAFHFEPVEKIGTYVQVDQYINKHITMVKKYPLVDVNAIRKAAFRVVVDAVNSTGGIAVPALLKELGVTTIKKMYCKPDGNFAHSPEPLSKNLKAICTFMKAKKYDLGIAVDPDVDRLAFIQEDGNAFGEEYTLVAIADYVLSQKKGCVVSNLSSTQAVKDVTERAQCHYYASAVGEVNVVQEMKKVKAVIGGEGNGGIIVPDFHYGRDALIGIALFLTYLAKTKEKISQLKKRYPFYYLSKGKIELIPNVNANEILEKVKRKYQNEKVNALDGVKIIFQNTKEWIHLRCSNTEPILRIYAESSSKTNADALIKKIMSDIDNIVTSK